MLAGEPLPRRVYTLSAWLLGCPQGENCACFAALSQALGRSHSAAVSQRSVLTGLRPVSLLLRGPLIADSTRYADLALRLDILNTAFSFSILYPAPPLPEFPSGSVLCSRVPRARFHPRLAFQSSVSGPDYLESPVHARPLTGLRPFSQHRGLTGLWPFPQRSGLFARLLSNPVQR